MQNYVKFSRPSMDSCKLQDEKSLHSINLAVTELKTKYSSWFDAWKTQKEKLLNQKGLLGFYEDFDEVC